jgi:predicted Zn-dependent protease
MHTSLASFPPRPRRAAGHLIRCLCVALPLSLAVNVLAVSEPSAVTGKKQSFGYSWQQELKLGADADKELTESMGLYDNPQVQAYVESVGQRVLQSSTFNSPNVPDIYKNTKFTFRVMDSPVVNAFALPGGYVYVTRGLLTHVQNEAQLATVLGHEIAHVAARHSSQQARRSQWGQLGVIAGAILGQKVLGEKMPNIGESVLAMGSQAAELFLLRHSREAEHESDNLGVAYAARAGYAAGDSARFFHSLQRISQAEGKSLPAWQSTHPDPGDRAQRVVQIAAASSPPGAASNLGEEQYLRNIEGIVVGDNPREGFARNGIFYHPELRFQMPVAAGWKMDNQRAAVVFAEPNGRAIMGLKLAPGSRARDAATQFATQSKIQVVTSGDTHVNGLPTTVIIGKANTEKGEVTVWDAFIEMDGKVYSILGYAPPQVFEQMRPTFESVAAGFSPLQVPELANVQPARLKLVRADRNAPFASFVPTSLPENISADEVAIMNQVALNDGVNQGRILKVPDVPPNPQPTRAQLDASRQQRWPNRTQQQQRYPQQSTYPQQNYPQTTYPNQSGYPADPRYPDPNRDPQRSGNYPQSYPPQGNYPAQYPNTGPTYPQSYPQQNYPQQNYPQQGYPQQNTPQSYPQQGYPRSGYPAQSDAPQFPQMPGAQNQSNPSSPQPAWPR